MTLRNISIGNFLKRLGSDAPSPGGGAAAAVAGSLGAALLEMVARINGRRSGQRPAPDRVRAFSRARVQFISLAVADTAAYDRLAKFSKEKRKGGVYQLALRKAAFVPLGMCRLAVRTLTRGRQEVGRTSRWLASDLAEGGILLHSAARSARLNVEINLKSMGDRRSAGRIRKELRSLAAKAKTTESALTKVFKP